MVTAADDAVPLTLPDVAWLKGIFPAQAVDEKIEHGEFVIDEERAKNYVRPRK